MDNPTLTLNDDVEIPQLGLGTWQLTGDDCVEAVKTALTLGYRHIDTAYHYNNHEQVGEAINQSPVAREEIFVTTKIWFDHADEERVEEQLDESLEQLDMDYVDLVLLHWPSSDTAIEETLGAFETAKQAGKVKSYGVSNFTIDHLEEIKEAGLSVANNQVEFHPSFNQKELKQYCDREGIVLTAYSPLGRTEDLSLDAIKAIAAERDADPAAVIVSWLIEKDMVAIPKASSREHLEANLTGIELQLTREELARIEQCEQKGRMLNPDFAQF